MSKNPYIEPFNHFSGYQDSVEKLKQNPELVEFDKMCYDLFEHYPAGRDFMKYVEKRFLVPALCQINSNNYQLEVIQKEGFKEAFRMLKSCADSHSQRIKAEANK